MSITRINTNYDAMFAGNQLKKIEASISRSAQRLATGLRINSASDDPSGVAQLSYATAQVRGNGVAIQNIQEVKALANYIDGALSTAESYLMQMRDTASRMANDATVTAQQFTNLSTEFTNLAAGLDALAASANWGGMAVLNGGVAGTAVAQVGPNTANSFSAGVLLSVVLAAAPGAPGTAAAAAAMLSTIDGQLSAIGTSRSNAGVVSRLTDLMLEDQYMAQANNTATLNTIGGADMAAEVTELAAGQVLAQAAAAIVTQAGSLQSQIVMSLIS